jgi:Nucleotidyl transferase AbiEii toxin, Type IV TA system
LPKKEAIIVLGARNSRIKDFFDLQYLGKRFAFNGATLTDAIRRTLDRRGTAIPAEEPIGLRDGYWREPGRSTQIVAFTRRTGLNVDAGKIAGVTRILREFLLPILEKLRAGQSLVGTWDPGGPWRP